MDHATVIRGSPAPRTNSWAAESWLEDRRNWFACIGAVLVLQSVLVIIHRPWLDEWQALQISLQSPSMSALFENLRYEGHPPPWYLILRAAGSVVSPKWILPAVQLPIALALQAIVLFRLPFGRLERLLWACNPYLLIDYGAISRSLGLGILLFMAAVAFRERKGAWLLLALLPSIDFLFGVLSIALIVISWREKRLWAPGLVLWLAVALASAWFVRPAPDLIPAFAPTGAFHDSLIEFSRFGALLLPVAIANGHLIWNETPPLAAAIIGGPIFIGIGISLLRADKLACAIFGAFVSLVLVFSVCVYPLAIRHVSLAATLLVALVGLQPATLAAKGRVFEVWLVIGACCGIAAAAANLLRPFDTASDAADFIMRQHLEAKHWAAFPDSRGQGVSALTGIEFDRLELNCTESFIRWNYRTKINYPSDLERELSRVASRGSFYLLTDFDLKREAREAAAYRQIFFVPEGVDGQQYFLYQVRPDLHESRAPAKCLPSRLPLAVR